MTVRCYLILCLLLHANVLDADDADTRQAVEDAKIVQTLLRLKGIDVNATPRLKSAVLRHLETCLGTERYVDLAERLGVKGIEETLVQLALRDSAGTAGVKAATLLLKRNEERRFSRKLLSGTDQQAAVRAAEVLGFVGNDQSFELLGPCVTSASSRAVQVAAASALGRNRKGQEFLLGLVQEGSLPRRLNFAVANALHASPDPRIRREIAKHLQLPTAVNSKPLPPVATLVGKTGDVQRGRQLFQTTATCIKCHRVNGQGKEVGPDLSEIGSKLTREGFFVSILDPSAGISHNFETYVAVLNNGNIATGVLINRTAGSITLRTAEAIDKEIAADDVDELVKSDVSLMPADIQKLLAVQDLVDVVEYLTTLKKRK